MNNDIEYLYGITSEEELEEITTTSEEELEETTTTSEEELEETTTTSEEELETTIDIIETTTFDYSELIETTNNNIMLCYDMLTYIFIVLLFILFRTYVIHIFESIRSIGKE